MTARESITFLTPALPTDQFSVEVSNDGETWMTVATSYKLLRIRRTTPLERRSPINREPRDYRTDLTKENTEDA